MIKYLTFIIFILIWIFSVTESIFAWPVKTIDSIEDRKMSGLSDVWECFQVQWFGIFSSSFSNKIVRNPRFDENQMPAIQRVDEKLGRYYWYRWKIYEYNEVFTQDCDNPLKLYIWTEIYHINLLLLLLIFIWPILYYYYRKKQRILSTEKNSQTLP